MRHCCQKERISVTRIGKLDITETYRVLIQANEAQKAFFFDYLSKPGLELPVKYKLKNGGYDISGAVKELSHNQLKDFPRPLIILTADPLGDPENPDEPDDFYFSTREDDYDEYITIISTYPLKFLPANRTFENYLTMMLSTYILSNYVDLPFHEITKGCFLDYCNKLSDAEISLRNGKLCSECEQIAQKKIRQNKTSMEILTAGMRLLNKAVGRKYCFVAMPLNDSSRFDNVYGKIKEGLNDLGWETKRADEIAFPRLITDKIYREILTSDLVIADLTKFNPNVFYEVGLSHVIGNDLLLLTQEKDIPFDLKNEQTIFYKEDDLEYLKKEIIRCVG